MLWWCIALPHFSQLPSPFAPSLLALLFSFRKMRVHPCWWFSLDQECTFQVTLPCISSYCRSGLYRLNSFWRELNWKMYSKSLLRQCAFGQQDQARGSQKYYSFPSSCPSFSIVPHYLPTPCPLPPVIACIVVPVLRCQISAYLLN